MDHPILEKRCSRCGEIKPVDDFYKDRKMKDGLTIYCKACSLASSKAYYKANTEKAKAARYAYYNANREKHRACVIAWNEANPEKLRAYTKAWRDKNPDKILAANRAWRKANREKVNTYAKEREANLRKIDPKFKLNGNIKAAINKALKGAKAGRHWETLVGYTIDELKRHIEMQFVDGMRWYNMGKWHIDHITPISAFNFETPDHEDFKRCWALKNLRPLWAEDNLRKSNKLTKHFQPSLAL